MSRPARLALLALVSSLVASAAHAQAPDTSLRTAVSAVPPGAMVRVETRTGLRYVAPIAGSMADGFGLRDTAATIRTFPYADISRFWVRKRAIGAGVTTGAVVGAAFGALVGLVASELCESSDCGSVGGYMLTGGVVFGAIGAAGGAIIGAAIPRWSEKWAGGPRAARHGATSVMAPAAGANPEIERHRIGEFSVLGLAGYGGFPPDSLTPDKSLMAGFGAGLAFRAGPVAFGPEAGVLFGTQRNWSLGGMARVDLREPRGTAPVPYLVGGLGGVFWHGFEYGADELLTVTVGAGVTLGARWRVEARWQPAVQNTGFPKPTLFTIAAGPRLVW